MLTKLLVWIANKTWLKGVVDLGDIVGPLIAAEELIKLQPELAQRLKVRYSELRNRIRERYGRDIVAEIANSMAIGELTVEGHARAAVAANEKSTSREWIEILAQEAVAASDKAYALYFK